MKHDDLFTRSQQYADPAYQLVDQLEQTHKFSKAEIDAYGSMAHKLPVLIRTSGLAQALTFVMARYKNKKGPKLLLTHIADVIKEGNEDILWQKSREASLEQYMVLTQKVLEVLVWFKRFVQARWDVSPTSE